MKEIVQEVRQGAYVRKGTPCGYRTGYHLYAQDGMWLGRVGNQVLEKLKQINPKGLNFASEDLTVRYDDYEVKGLKFDASNSEVTIIKYRKKEEYESLTNALNYTGDISSLSTFHLKGKEFGEGANILVAPADELHSITSLVLLSIDKFGDFCDCNIMKDELESPKLLKIISKVTSEIIKESSRD